MIEPHQLTNTKTGRDPFNRLPSSPKNPLDKCTFRVSRFGGSSQCSRWRLLDPFDRRAPARVDLGDEDGRRLWDQSDVPDGILPDGPRDNSSTSTSRNSVGSPNPGTESPAEGQVTTTATSAGEPPRLCRRHQPCRLRRSTTRRRSRHLCRVSPTAIAWFDERGITVERVMTDNGPGHKSKAWAEFCADREIKHLRTRPYRPRTNGKAERFIRTMCSKNGPTLWSTRHPTNATRRSARVNSGGSGETITN